MVDEKLQFVITAVDEVTKVLLNIDRRLEQVADQGEDSNKVLRDASESTTRTLLELDAALGILQKSFAAVQTAVRAVAGGFELAITQFTDLTSASGDLVNEYAAVERANISLDSVLRATGNLTAENSERWGEFAGSLSDFALVGSEELLPLITRLGAFAGFNDQLEQASRAAVDLSAAFGVSLESAFSKFIKAVNSGNLELAEGVSFQLQATTQAERLAEAIGFVNDRFGGTAEAIASGGSSALRQLEVTLDAVRQRLGQVIAESPFFQAFVGAVKTALEDTLSFLDENSDQLGRAFSEGLVLSFRVAASAAQVLATSIFSISEGLISLGERFNIIPTIEGTREAIDDAVQEIQLLQTEIERAVAFDPSQSRSGFQARSAQDLGAQQQTEIDRLAELRAQLRELEENDALRTQLRESVDLLKSEFTGVAGQFVDDVVEGTKEGLSAGAEEGADAFAQKLQEVIARDPLNISLGDQDAGFTGGGFSDATEEELKAVFGDLVNSTETGMNEAFEAAAQTAVSGGEQFREAFEQGLRDGEEAHRLEVEAAGAVESAAGKAEESANSVNTAGIRVQEAASALQSSATDVFNRGAINATNEAANLEDQVANLTAESRNIADFERAIRAFEGVLSGTLEGGITFAQHGAILSSPTLIAGERGTEVIAPTGSRGSALLEQALGLSGANRARGGGGRGINLSINAGTVNMTADKGAEFAAAFERRITQGLIQRARLGA